MRSSAPRAAVLAPRARRVGIRAQGNLRPYTLRKGDTLETIAQKRSMKVDEIRKINSKLSSGAEAKVGDTILLPAGKLSARDKDIIDGITKINQPRIYPTRKGESIMDIIEPRGIAFEDVKKLNPGVNLGTFTKGDKLKLPPGKYTVREKEMLQGAASSRPRASTRCSSSSPKTRSTCWRAWRARGCTPSTLRRAGGTRSTGPSSGGTIFRPSATIEIENDARRSSRHSCVRRPSRSSFVAPSPHRHSCAAVGDTKRDEARRGVRPKPAPSVIRVVND